jgi:uncharacterized protein
MIEALPQTKPHRTRASEALFSVYKQIVSPILHAVSGVGGGCRFQPTCSEYAMVAIDRFGAVRGTWLALKRIAKCHPFHAPAFDPVPMQSSRPPVTIEESVFAEDAALRPQDKRR